MFCTVQVNGNLPIGTVVQFNTENQTWDTASTAQDTIGVIRETPVQNEDDLTWWVRVVFAGVVEALADRNIPIQGGRLNVSNGKVFVDNVNGGNGIISPISRGQADRVANSLVLVDIR